MSHLLGWAWESAVLVLGLELLLMVQSRLPARFRHGIWMAGLLWMGARGALAFGWGVRAMGQTLEPAAHESASLIEALWWIPIPAGASASLAVGLAVAVLASVRLILVLFGWSWLVRVKRDATPVQLDRLPPDVAIRIRAASRAGVELGTSDRVTMPAALGLGRPMIVLPRTLAGALETDELRCVLLHELAHLSRRDDRAALVQAIVEALFGFHPAVWWCGRRLREEREAACDDRVAEMTGDARAYAASLIEVAGAIASRGRGVGLAPGSGRSGPSLRRRIVRLVRQPRPSLPRALGVAAAVATVVAAVAGAALAGNLIVFAAAPELRLPGTAVIRQDGLASGLEPLAAPPSVIMVEDGSAPGRRTIRPRPRPAAQTAPADPAGIAVPGVASRVDGPADSWDRATAVIPIRSAPAYQAVPSVGATRRAAVEDSDRPVRGSSGWDQLADAGAQVGSAVARSGVRSAGFLSRAGRSMAAAFAP